jgi:hypothetical protein
VRFFVAPVLDADEKATDGAAWCGWSGFSIDEHGAIKEVTSSHDDEDAARPATADTLLGRA